MFSELQTKAPPELKEQLVELLQSELVPEMQQNRSVIAEALDGYAGDSHDLYLSLKRCFSELNPVGTSCTLCAAMGQYATYTTPPSPSENLMAGAL